MKKKSIKINAILNAIKTICTIIFPLITFPYVTRILGVTQIGKYSFSYSIISYFILLAALGVNNYAIREGAKYRDNRKKISEFSSEIYTINFISMIFSFLILFLVLLCFKDLSDYRLIILILSTEMIFNWIGVNWIFNVFEDFGKNTLITILFQLISLVAMFIFVTDINDLINYVVIVTISSCGSNLIFRLLSKKYVDLKIVFNKKMLKHLKPIFILFSTSVVSTIYVSSDTTLLGIMTTNYNVGLYSVSAKIYKIVKQLLLSLSLVAVPRLSYYFKKNEISKYQDLSSNVYCGLLSLCLPAAVGLICTSPYIISFVFGEEYIESIRSLQILGISLSFAILSSFYANCVLIPANKEKQLFLATIVSATINIIGNLFLIPIFYQDAAAFTTVLSELIMAIICWVYSKKILKIQMDLKTIFAIVFGCALIGIECLSIYKLMGNKLIGLIISIVISMSSYFIIHFIFKSHTYKTLENILIKRKLLKHKSNIKNGIL